MANIPKYSLYVFDKAAAASGKLCVIVPNDYVISTDPTDPEYPTEINSMIKDEDDPWTPNPDFIGAGICRFKGPSTFFITVDSVTYSFNDRGNPISINALPYKIVMGEAQITLSEVGNTANSTSSSIITRNSEGDSVETDYEDSAELNVGGLNARDQFAVQAMRAMMSNIRDASALSDTDINYYCNAAYRWAANMMVASASARAAETIDNRPAGQDIDTRMEDIDSASLESDTDRLLNNIALALQRTDYEQSSTNGTWKKSGKESIVGPNTDAFVKEHTNAFSDDPEYPITTAADAYSAGWMWYPIYEYSERIINPTIDSFLSAYVAHTPENQQDTKTKVGLDDLINAIKGIQGGGGGGSSSGQVTVTSMPAVDVGATGLGRDNDHPIYISGGGFPTRDALGATFAKNVLHDILTFNTAGAVGYTPITEIVSLIDDRIEAYLDSLEVVADSSKPSGYAIQYTAP